MNILSRDTLHHGGFAGIEETRLVKDGDLVRAQDIDLKVISDDAHLTLIGLDGD